MDFRLRYGHNRYGLFTLADIHPITPRMYSACMGAEMAYEKARTAAYVFALATIPILLYCAEFGTWTPSWALLPIALYVASSYVSYRIASLKADTAVKQRSAWGE